MTEKRLPHLGHFAGLGPPDQALSHVFPQVPTPGTARPTPFRPFRALRPASDWVSLRGSGLVPITCCRIIRVHAPSR